LLQRSDAATTVENVAMSCGFADVGHFAEAFIGAFGKHPSRTLGGGG
jgi:transcriptional regulator GlxA family with amidase domain